MGLLILKRKVLKMANEWYRKKTWTKDDESEFFAKLQRARKDGRAQYLMLQAYALSETDNKELWAVALNLIQKYFDEYSDDQFEKSGAYGTVGKIYCKMGEYDLALESYKKAVEQEKAYPGVRTGAFLDFSQLAIHQNRTDLFDDIEAVLLDNIEECGFPSSKYIECEALSTIYKHKNDLERANYYKILAEETANDDDSCLVYYRKFGHGENRDEILEKYRSILDKYKKTDIANISGDNTHNIVKNILAWADEEPIPHKEWPLFIEENSRSLMLQINERGVEVRSIDDLLNPPKSIAPQLGELTDILISATDSLEYHPVVIECVVRCLGRKAIVKKQNLFSFLYEKYLVVPPNYKIRNPHARSVDQAFADALSHHFTWENFDKIETLLRDKSLGESRGLLINAFTGFLHKEEARQLLTELSEDPEFAFDTKRLLKRKVRNLK